MAKKKKQQVLSNDNPILQIQYDDPLFAMAAHPTQNMVVSGLATGHVYMHRYNDKLLQEILDKNLEKVVGEDEEAQAKAKKTKPWTIYACEKQTYAQGEGDGEGDDEKLVECLWKTKRHKQSCRVVLMDPVDAGQTMYTIGKDKIIKKAFTETGKVDFKSSFTDMEADFSCAVHSSTHSHLVTGDENGNVKVFDSKNKFQKIFSLDAVHDDMVNQIVQVPNSSVYHYLSVGSTTVAKIDIRNSNALLQSENQEDEVLSACFANPSSNLLLCGMGTGVVTLWNEKKNAYEDQISRIKLSKENSIDCLMGTMQDDDLDSCWAGCADGVLYKVNGKKSAVLETRVHDLKDEVSFLDIDYDFRVVSGSMGSLKIWQSGENDKAAEDDDDDDDDDDDNDDFDHSDSSSDDSDNSDAEKERLAQLLEQQEKARKEEARIASLKRKKEQSTAPKKTLKSVKQNHENGIRRFDDL